MDANSILRYDRITGEFIDALVTSGSGGLDDPRVFGFFTDRDDTDGDEDKVDGDDGG